MISVYECSCGDLHVIRWDPHGGIDGDYTCVCPERGKLQLRAAYGEFVSGSRIVTNIEGVCK